MRYGLAFVALLCLPLSAPLTAQQRGAESDSATEWAGPLKDVSYELVWLIESEDKNRKPYDGPARKGLTDAGFGRVVQAGSVRSSVTIGQESKVSGHSRYGPLTASATMLNTTHQDELQIAIELYTKTTSPVSIETTVRVPLDHWFLLGAADSRVGLPLHEADGKRSVLIMRISNGVPLLD
jgi:hypothetical protein